MPAQVVYEIGSCKAGPYVKPVLLAFGKPLSDGQYWSEAAAIRVLDSKHVEVKQATQ